MVQLELPLLEGDPPWGPVAQPALPPARGVLRCEVAVVGAGVVGLTAALAAARRGLEVAVLDAARVGAGSTPASTALLLWETDTDLAGLAERLGPRQAAEVWRAGHATLDWMGDCAREERLGGFARARSVHHAEAPEDAVRLRAEAAQRRAAGLPSALVEDPQPVAGFTAPGALVSEGAATVSPARLLGDLLRACLDHGVAVHGGSPVREVRGSGAQGPGFEVQAEHVLVATGARALEAPSLRGLARQRMTYVLAVEDPARGLREDVVAWSAGKPYHYLRREGDLLLLGGEDRDPREASSAGDVPFARLRGEVGRLFPALADAPERARWAGMFPSTPDGLPYAGPLPGGRGADAVLAFGGNGMVYGLLGAWLQARRYAGEEVAGELAPFAFERAATVDRPRQTR